MQWIPTPVLDFAYVVICTLTAVSAAAALYVVMRWLIGHNPSDDSSLESAFSDLEHTVNTSAMVTLGWENPALMFEDGLTFVTGRCLVTEADADGQVQRTFQVSNLQIGVPNLLDETLTLDDEIAEIALTMHEGIPDSVTLTDANGATRSIQAV